MLKKILIISSVLLTLFIAGKLYFSRSQFLPHVFTAAQTTNQAVQEPASPADELLQSKDGVDVSVDEVKRENNQTILSLSINNHVQDYSQVDLKNQSDLAGIKPIKYTVDSAASGGHHLESELVFAGNLSGLLTIRLTDELTFNFDIK